MFLFRICFVYGHHTDEVKSFYNIIQVEVLEYMSCILYNVGIDIFL